MQWLKAILDARFEVKTKVIGTGPGESPEEKVLNRVIRKVRGGWEYEADQRHGELVVRGMGMENAKAVKSPGEDQKPWEEEENGVPLDSRSATSYRALAARVNYLAQDRADIQYAAKEVCRGMATPTRGDEKSCGV